RVERRDHEHRSERDGTGAAHSASVRLDAANRRLPVLARTTAYALPEGKPSLARLLSTVTTSPNIIVFPSQTARTIQFCLLISYSVELMPILGGDDAARQRQGDCPLFECREPRDEAQRRDEQDVRVEQTGRGITGHAEERFPVDEAKGGGFSGLHRDAVKQHLAAV